MNQRHDPGQTRDISQPEPGYFLLRLVKGGWQVPCQISCAFGHWFAVIDGTAYPSHRDPVLAERVSEVWERGLKIDAGTYASRLALKVWADPGHPCLHPRRPINPMELPPMIPRISDEPE